MAQQWYVSRSGTQDGPFSSSQLKELAVTKKLKPDDLVWMEGMAEWAQASNVKGLFPPSPPPIPPTGVSPPSVIRPDPVLGRVVTPDADVNEAWKLRESPLGGHVGVLGGFLGKQIHEQLFTHKVRLFKKHEDGRVIGRDEIVEQLGMAFRNRGFQVQSFPASLIATKRSNNNTVVKIDTSPNALANVSTHTNALIRIAETDDSWIAEAKCEAFFWPKVMDQLMGASSLLCVAVIFFWPCLCLVPFVLAIDAEQVRQAVEADTRTAMDKLTIDFA